MSLQVYKQKCSKMLDNQIRDTRENKKKENHGSHFLTDSQSRISDRKRKNANLEINDNTKSCAWVISHKKSSKISKNSFNWKWR